MQRIRVAMHVHSEWSFDAQWPLQRIAGAFERRGYDVVMLCDHDRGFDPEDWIRYRRACAHASSDRLLLIAGTEYADPDNLVHVPVWGVPFLGESLPTLAVLQAVVAHRGVAVLAHPGRRGGWRSVDRTWLPMFTGIEAWNRKYDGWLPSPEAARLLTTGSGCLPIVSLDFHRRRQFFPLAMRLDLDGPVTEAAVLAALRSHAGAAQAFRLPLSTFSSRAAQPIMTAAERVRRPLARAARSVLDRKRGKY
jgi:hypothetical protein